MNITTPIFVLGLLTLAGCSLATDFEHFRGPGNRDAAAGDSGAGDGDGDGPDASPDLDGGPDAAPAVEGQIDVELKGEPLGTVLSAPAGIDCGSDCNGVFPSGSEVVLTATPDPTAAFAGWGGACKGQKGLTCTLVAGTPLEVSAAFTADWFDVTVVTIGEGKGEVTSSDGMMSCDGSVPEGCTVRYPRGSRLALAAEAGKGSAFSGWGGSCAGTADCELVVDSLQDDQRGLRRRRHGLADRLQAGQRHRHDHVRRHGPRRADQLWLDLRERLRPRARQQRDPHRERGQQLRLRRLFRRLRGPERYHQVCGERGRRARRERHLRAQATRAHSGLGWGGRRLRGRDYAQGARLHQACHLRLETYEHGSTVTLEARAATGSTFREWSLEACGTSASCDLRIDGPTVMWPRSM